MFDAHRPKKLPAITFGQLKKGDTFLYEGHLCGRGQYLGTDVAICIEDGEHKWTVWPMPPFEFVKKVDVKKQVTQKDREEIRRRLQGLRVNTPEHNKVRDELCRDLGLSKHQVSSVMHSHKFSRGG